jgi:hypothetical protein
LTAADQRKLVETCSQRKIIGGTVYDARIAAAAVRAKANLLTLDARARATYAAFGANHEFVR